MILATIFNDKIKIEFEGFIEKTEFNSILSKIKGINGRSFHSNQNPKYWSIPLSEKETLLSLFPGISIKTETKTLATQNIAISTDFVKDMKLRPFNFQIIGINFLLNRKKCLLGDTMGLGKTIQVLGASYKLLKNSKIKKVLIICPSSVKYQWADEIEKFLPIDKYLVIDGDLKKRLELYAEVKDNNIVYTILNYELARVDIEQLLKFKWDVVVCDEAHRIKNHETLTYESIMRLNSEYKWAATGTPVQNRPDELFNIFSWIDKTILGNRWVFRKTYFDIGKKYGKNNMILGYKNLTKLHHIIKPHYIRRLTKEVAPELPELIISNRYIEMTKEQEALHREINDRAFELIKRTGDYNEYNKDGNLIHKHPQTDLIKGLYAMMQVVADAPELLKLSESKMAKGYLSQIKNFKSPKIEELFDIVKTYLDEDSTNKIVVFSRFEKIQSLLVKKLKSLTNCVVINGKQTPAEKHTNLSNFKINPKIGVLIASDAMNYGVNCQEASLVVQFDLPYNPAVYHQRNGRIHRIGTKHEVLKVINLISINSIDEKIYDILLKKESLSQEIIEKRDQDDIFSVDIGRKLLGD